MPNRKTPIQEFYQIFADSINETLSASLDTDICKNILFQMTTAQETKISEGIEVGNVLYKLDFAVGNSQGNLIILIPEELVASISDILTGGEGDKPFKGELSELEINSFTNLLDKIFKKMEEAFKHAYSKDIAFSANPKFLTKGMPDFGLTHEDTVHDFVFENSLSLNEGSDCTVSIYTSFMVVQDVMNDMGLSKSNIMTKKPDVSALDVNRISDVKINITAELGRTRVPIKYALELVSGSLVELDTLNGSDIKVFANGVEFAYAQVVAIEDNFGLKITKIITPEERLDAI